jgi:hypothetical protein
MTFFNVQRLKDYFAIRQWRKTYQINAHLADIESYFSQINGFEVSKASRLEAPNLALTYGEIDLESFLALLSLAKINTNTVFYDLGCGLGKTVIACANVYSIKRAYGVECLADLLAPAIQYAEKKSQIQFLNQNILATDWSDANVLFLNVATFVPESWHAIAHKLRNQPVKTIITCGKSLEMPDTYQVRTTYVKTSWGIIPAYIYIAMTDSTK